MSIHALEVYVINLKSFLICSKSACFYYLQREVDVALDKSYLRKRIHPSLKIRQKNPNWKARLYAKMSYLGNFLVPNANIQRSKSGKC